MSPLFLGSRKVNKSHHHHHQNFWIPCVYRRKANKEVLQVIRRSSGHLKKSWINAVSGGSPLQLHTLFSPHLYRQVPMKCRLPLLVHLPILRTNTIVTATIRIIIFYPTTTYIISQPTILGIEEDSTMFCYRQYSLSSSSPPHLPHAKQVNIIKVFGISVSFHLIDFCLKICHTQDWLLPLDMWVFVDRMILVPLFEWFLWKFSFTREEDGGSPSDLPDMGGWIVSHISFFL